MKGKVFISVNDADKPMALTVAKRYAELGFELVSTAGTAKYFAQQAGLVVQAVLKKHEGQPNVETLILANGIQLLINTPSGDDAIDDDSYIR